MLDKRCLSSGKHERAVPHNLGKVAHAGQWRVQAHACDASKRCERGRSAMRMHSLRVACRSCKLALHAKKPYCLGRLAQLVACGSKRPDDASGVRMGCGVPHAC